jgi:dTMP kinase
MAVSLQRVGLLVAFEGIDGSGKGTQARLLAERAGAGGLATAAFSFPRYGANVFADAVGRYLNGAWPGVPPEFPALLYAGDRLAARDELLQAAGSADLVVLDRYVASNLAHQAANAEPDRRDELIAWISAVEYGVHALPRPDLTVLLELPVESARERVRQKAPRAYTELAEDVLEGAADHLAAAAAVYATLARREVGWVRVDAARDADAVAGDVWRAVEERW